MKARLCFFLITIGLLTSCLNGQKPLFDKERDLLLAQFDCKTDVDDLHTVAAFATLMEQPDYRSINHHAVAGTYGIQEGLYVPANDLFALAFGDNWSDAHADVQGALQKVAHRCLPVLKEGGDVWIAEAGQSDFSAKLVKELMDQMPDLNIKKRVHIVQHSDWNEEVTDAEHLTFVKTHTDYHKISDGNAVGNGTPGFRSDDPIDWRPYVTGDRQVKIWETAIELANRYNGKEGRYLNESIAKGGLDFSDLSETCYLLGLAHLTDGKAFFAHIAQ
ncbi:MAG: hypothetical protein CMH48_03950 [Muricauda sp.]|nr:hypothetical protein [Allomuricauda sp.]MBC29978.1 hypothetical protein [Allomuricauda sp.]|tara:strand:- start:102617 stop:103441 length:825 start_codon:yes stop_codon:yes gene_type:complete